jgi:hypothetical protein
VLRLVLWEWWLSRLREPERLGPYLLGVAWEKKSGMVGRQQGGVSDSRGSGQGEDGQDFIAALGDSPITALLLLSTVAIAARSNFKLRASATLTEIVLSVTPETIP